MTFLAPIFLAGLLAIGLPIWLHRLSSENPNRRPFSSLMFLEAGEPQRVLAQNVQYLLLLALRIALLALLVLAFIQPAFWRTPAAAAADGARFHIVVVDQSASMAAGDRWSDAIELAIDTVNSLPAGDPAQVIAAARSIELVTAPGIDRAIARQGLLSLQPGIFHSDFGQLTRALDGVLRNAELPVVLHLVTDAQATGLPTRFAELAPTLPVELQIHQVGDPTEENWAIESLAGSAVSGELTAVIRSYAATDQSARLTLELNDAVTARLTVPVAAGATVPVEFPPLALASGSNRVRVSVPSSDEFATDDQRFLALKRPTPRPVLVVSGDLRANDTLFIASAMESLDALALTASTIQASGLADETLADYAFIVIAEASLLSGDAESRLLNYVESGGGLLLALGPRSTSLTTVPVTGQALVSGPQALTRSDASTAVGVIDTSHPILRGLEALRAARFDRQNSIEIGEQDRVLMALETGAPLLIESNVGAGRVLLFTSSLGKEWNDLPLQPVFVPLVAGLAEHLLGGAGFSNEAPLGSTLALRALGMQGGQIFDPAGEPALSLGGTDDVLLNQIGFYELVGGGQTELVAVNFDSRESDLAAAPADTVARWQGLGQTVQAASVAPGIAAERVLLPIGRWLLLLLLAVLVVESWIGNWHLRVRRGIAA